MWPKTSLLAHFIVYAFLCLKMLKYEDGGRHFHQMLAFALQLLLPTALALTALETAAANEIAAGTASGTC
jgi:cytochrome b